MPVDIDRLEGYRPTEETLLRRLGIRSIGEMREVVLERCKLLSSEAKKKDKTSSFGTPYTFILCKSTDFFSIFAKMGHGSGSMVIKDDLSPEVFFLMFEDKIPEKFYPIAAAHEATEYRLVFLEGMDQGKAHKAATMAELEKAKSLHLAKGYNNFLKTNYPGKYKEMKSWSKNHR